MIGQARDFAYARNGGILQDKPVTGYPIGAEPNSFEAWFRPSGGGIVISRGGNWQAGRVIIGFSVLGINVDCYGCGVSSTNRLALDQWYHVIHTYDKGESRLYINGKFENASRHELHMPDKYWMAMGCYAGNLGSYAGKIDEVRVSKVARSADWISMQYENQKPLQTLLGHLVRPGDKLAVSQQKMTVMEGTTATVTAQAGDAQKVYWILKDGEQETVAAVDTFAFTFVAGRVAGDKPLTLRLKAVYPNTVKTLDIPILVKEDIPEPAFTLKAPAEWDGRKTIELTPEITNLSAMQAKDAGKLDYDWRLSPNLAVIKQITPGKLTLKRAQNSGPLAVTLAIRNGGTETTRTIAIQVQEPRKKDAWVERVPVKDEKPVDNQFYARDDNNEGTLFYNGSLTDNTADTVFLKIYADEVLYKKETRKLAADKSYAFTVKLKPGLIKYRVEFGTQNGNPETILQTVTNLVCGDAYLISGQSNAVASEAVNPYFSEWIRSYGNQWGVASCQGGGQRIRIGYWGVELARQLMETYKIPICILNGAVGGTIIEAHRRNPGNPLNPGTLYGQLLARVTKAGLTHGIRGFFWHQGENDQGSAGSSGLYGWQTYQDYFMDLSAAWKEDCPNIQNYYVFQIWPNACMMGVNESGDMLREVQRTLPNLYSNLKIMSTLGINPEGGCHYPAEGYAVMAHLISGVVEQDNYGKSFPGSMTAPNLKAAAFTSDKRDEITLEFDQPLVWNPKATKEFYLDGAAGKVVSGTVSGKIVTLKLIAGSTAKRITYVIGRSWSQANLLSGTNGIAALTFCNVPLSDAKH
ncbi:MAG: LamG-like jellyroll fold domain-containing protein [Verrucomicrobiota bacterium]